MGCSAAFVVIGLLLHLGGVVSPGWLISSNSNGAVYSGLLYVVECPREESCFAKSWFETDSDQNKMDSDALFPRQYVTVGKIALTLLFNIAASVTCYRSSTPNVRKGSQSTLSTILLTAISSTLTLTVIADYLCTTIIHSSTNLQSTNTFPYSLAAAMLGTLIHVVVSLSFYCASRRALRRVRIWDDDEVRPLYPPDYDSLSVGITNPLYSPPTHHPPRRVQREQRNRYEQDIPNNNLEEHDRLLTAQAPS